MRIRHGALSVDVPADFTDESTLVFVSGKRDLPPTTARVTEEPVALTIKLAAVEPNLTPRALLDARCADLREHAESFEVLSEGAIRSGLGDGWSRTVQVRAADAGICQLIAVFVLDRVAVTAIGSTSDVQFAANEARLRRMVESLDTPLV